VTEPLPPYVKADPVVPVRLAVAGEQRQGEVLGWRGERVYVRYRTQAGNHLAWLPAGAVERLD
jgi:hypothetical protein